MSGCSGTVSRAPPNLKAFHIASFNAMNSGKCKYVMRLHVLISYGTLVAKPRSAVRDTASRGGAG